MDRRIVAAVAATCAGFLPAARALAVVAFPGAGGFAANVTGGRPVGPGTYDVYHVTTLADDPNHVIPGSLFYGLYNAKNVTGRTIVFDVGGTIKLGSSTLDIKNIDNVTIAGQTAPVPVTIVGNTVQITSSSGDTTSNIILQHVGIRKGLANSGDALSIKGSGTGTTNIMVDHVSGSWSEDEVISVGGATNMASNVTVQYSTMSEALTSGHQYGSLIRSRNNSSVSYLHNLYSNNASRNPRPGTYLGSQLDFEFQNNVIYNWGDRAGYTGGASEADTENVNMNYVGNYLIAGPSTVGGPTTADGTPVVGARRNTAFIKDMGDDPLNLNIYQANNKIDWAAGALRDGQDIGWGMFATSSPTGPYPAADQEPSRFLYPASTPDSADDAYGKVMAAVGMVPYARSATDQRLVNEVINYTGAASQSTPNAGEWTALDTAVAVSRPAGFDTDNDGMPNAWESLRGFNPAVADSLVVLPEGYSRLEKYLHSMSAIANWNLNGDGNWSDYLNWRGMRPGSSDATARFIAGITAPRTVTVNAPVTVGALSFDGANAYTLAGASALTVDVFAGSATIDVAAGSHNISAPLVLSDNTIVTVPAGSTLTASNLQPTSVTVSKTGAGTLAVNNIRAGGLTIAAGTVKVLPNSTSSGVSRVASLSNSGKIDLTDNKLIVAGGGIGSWNGSQYTGITGQVQSGRGDGSWNGTGGILTSMTDATTGVLTTLAVATAAETGYGGGTFGGISVAGGDVLVMYTWGGDADLNGELNGDDYFYLDSNILQSGSVFGFHNGDFNYDGELNGDDYFILDSNILQAQGSGIVWSTGSGALASVPEPASMAFAGIAASLGLLRRRRRGSR